MKTSFVSTLALQTALKLQVQTGQLALTRAQTEASTGQYADFGLALGGRTSNAVSLSNNVGQLQTILDSNSLVNTRLSSAQDALGQISDNAQTALDALLGITGSSGASQVQIVQNTVKSAFGAVTGAANQSAGGEFLFGGINTSVPPLDDYFAAGSPAKAAFDASFQSQFGFAVDDPAVSGITGAQMNAFIDQLSSEYAGADWQANWSKASDTTLSARINTNEVISTSTTTNSRGFRSLALGSVLGMELLGRNLSAEAQGVVARRATTAIGDAISAIDADRSTLGVAQSRVTRANTSLKNQIDLVNTQMNDLEGVDPYEAATRVNALKTQLETSYALTSRLSQLSLLNYL